MTLHQMSIKNEPLTWLHALLTAYGLQVSCRTTGHKSPQNGGDVDWIVWEYVLLCMVLATKDFTVLQRIKNSL